MIVRNIGKQIFMDKLSGSYRKKEQKEEGYTDVLGRFESQADDNDTEELQEKKISNGIQLDYHSGKISTQLAIMETGRIHAESTMECEVKHLELSECDGVKNNIWDGYLLKAKVHLDEHKVYVEYKNEDGIEKAYEVNPLKVPEDSTNPVENLAKKCWDLAQKQLDQEGIYTEVSLTDAKENEETQTATFEEAFAKFYAFVEERVKNGPPKIQTGGGAYSLDEWEALLEKVDGEIDAVKEAQEAEKEAWEKEQLEQLLSGKTKGSSFADRLSGKKKAPYSELADDSGMVEYNGVTFFCDDEKQQITLGDVGVAAEKAGEVLTIPLENGGCLKVNRDSIGLLSKAIGMFSPEDVERILRAIAQDTKTREMKLEMEETVAQVRNL